MRVNQLFVDHEIDSWHRIDIFYKVESGNKTQEYDGLVIKWITENCHGLWCWRQRLDYSFQDANDAMLFTLRWMQ
jgi:hypothetical protein